MNFATLVPYLKCQNKQQGGQQCEVGKTVRKCSQRQINFLQQFYISTCILCLKKISPTFLTVTWKPIIRFW